jgi:hypothetical protein
MVNRSDRDDVHAPAFGHPLDVTPVAGDHGDVICFGLLDRCTKVRVCDGDLGPLPDARSYVGVFTLQRDVSDWEPIRDTPRWRRPIPTGLDPDRGRHCHTDLEAADGAPGRDLKFIKHATVLAMPSVAQRLYGFVIQQEEPVHAAP